MQELKHLQGALGWTLLGLLVTEGLINLISFVSPFWGLATAPGSLEASRDLLKFWQPIVPWFSVVFVVAAWHLAMTTRTLAARAGVLAMGVLVPVAHVVAAAPPKSMAALLAEAYLALVPLAFVALAWWAVRRSRAALVPGT